MALERLDRAKVRRPAREAAQEGHGRPAEARRHDVRHRASKAASGKPVPGWPAPGTRCSSKMEKAGSLTGAQATATFEQMTQQVQTAMRRHPRRQPEGGADAWLQSYAALVSGVLIGMSDALRPGRRRGRRTEARPPNPAGQVARLPARLHWRAVFWKPCHDPSRHQRHRPVPAAARHHQCRAGGGVQRLCRTAEREERGGDCRG